MPTAEPLPGLPVYGPPAISFPRPDAFSEGYVVEFTTDGGDTWVGNFAKFDDSGLCSLHSDLEPPAVVVVAGSVGYIVYAEEQRLVREIGFGIKHIWFDENVQAMIVTNGLWFEAFTANRTLWRSRRFSWDGIRNLGRDALTVTGEAFDPTAAVGNWLPFRLDLATGVVEGGSYNAP